MTRPDLLGTLESALYAEDLVAAEDFYGHVLGLEVLGRQEGRHVFFAVGPSVLLIFNPVATDAPPAPDARFPVPRHGTKGQGHFCFSVAAEALDAMRAHLEAHDVDIEADFRWPGGARSIYVRDPAGNSVEFAEPGLWFGNDNDQR